MQTPTKGLPFWSQTLLTKENPSGLAPWRVRSSKTEGEGYPGYHAHSQVVLNPSKTTTSPPSNLHHLPSPRAIFKRRHNGFRTSILPVSKPRPRPIHLHPFSQSSTGEAESFFNNSSKCHPGTQDGATISSSRTPDRRCPQHQWRRYSGLNITT